jgi:hypothetical protein
MAEGRGEKETKVVGTTKVSTGLRISLSKEAADIMEVREKDYVILVKGEEVGTVLLKKAR